MSQQFPHLNNLNLLYISRCYKISIVKHLYVFIILFCIYLFIFGYAGSSFQRLGFL